MDKKKLRQKIYKVVSNYCYDCDVKNHKPSFHRHQVDDLMKLLSD